MVKSKGPVLIREEHLECYNLQSCLELGKIGMPHHKGEKLSPREVQELTQVASCT